MMTVTTEWTGTTYTPPLTAPSNPEFGNIICGIACILIMVLGLLGNIPSILIFSSELFGKVYIDEKKLCFDSVFVCISITDTLICACMLPVIVSFLNDRDPAFFENETFCQLWGVVWTILPYMSIFLVAVLSFVRSYTLLRPLGSVSCRWLMATTAVYLSFLVLRSAVPLFAKEYSKSYYLYKVDSVACTEGIMGEEVNPYWHFKMITNMILLLVPIFPVTISCIVSFVILNRRTALLQVGSRVAKMQSEATKTILMVTVLYWICNVPVVAAYLYWHIGAAYEGKRNEEVTHVHLYRSVFMYWYSWPITIILSVGINSLLNPLVYFYRMRRFREVLVETAKTATEMISVTVRYSELTSKAKSRAKEPPEETVEQCKM